MSAVGRTFDGWGLNTHIVRRAGPAVNAAGRVVMRDRVIPGIDLALLCGEGRLGPARPALKTPGYDRRSRLKAG